MTNERMFNAIFELGELHKSLVQEKKEIEETIANLSDEKLKPKWSKEDNDYYLKWRQNDLQSVNERITKLDALFMEYKRTIEVLGEIDDLNKQIADLFEIKEKYKDIREIDDIYADAIKRLQNLVREKKKTLSKEIVSDITDKRVEALSYLMWKHNKKLEQQALNKLDEEQVVENSNILTADDNKDNRDDFKAPVVSSNIIKETPKVIETTENEIYKPIEEEKHEPKKVYVSFLNDEFPIEGYYKLKVDENSIIHGPVIEPTPLNFEGKPKLITAKTFDCWVDNNGNKVDLSKPITKDMTLNARFKFDKKKAAAVGLGVAVGALAYVGDLANPTPMPVLSMAGTVGFGLATKVSSLYLSNLTKKNNARLRNITVIDEIPKELEEGINKEKKNGYIKTFLKTATLACAISTSLHTFRNMKLSKMQASLENNNPVVEKIPKQEVKPKVVEKPVTQTPKVEAQVVDKTVSASKVEPQIVKEVVKPSESVPQKVFGHYNANGKVYQTSMDAINQVNSKNAYMPSFTGKYKYEALFNGKRIPLTEGTPLNDILSSLGANDPSQVALKVMNQDGIPLTWDTLDSVIETVSKGVTR